MLVNSMLGLLAVATMAVAQTIETATAASVSATTTQSESMPAVATQAFNANAVNSTTKLQWCLGQRNTCTQICGGTVSQNDCSEINLTYDCVCPNGTAPDVSSFAQTLPFFICQETYVQCVAAAPNDAQAQQVCTSNKQCGSRNATAEALSQTMASSDSTASSTSGSSSSSQTGSATSSASASASSSGNAAVTNVHQLSTGAFALLLAAACKLFL